MAAVRTTSTGSRDVDLRDVLELCRSVLTDAIAIKKEGAGALALPIVLGEVERWTETLRQVFDAAGGTVVVAAGDYPGSVPAGDPNSPAVQAVKAAVENAMTQLVAADPHSYSGLAVEFVDDEEVRISGTVSHGSANDAQQAARSLLAAMFHLDLRSSDLPVLIWDDSHFDAKTSRIIFELATNLPTLLDLPAGIVLVLVAGDSVVRPEYHCTGADGVRYVLSGTRGLQSREPHSTSVNRIREWTRNDVHDAPLRVLFLGAGASVSAGLPTGNQLRNEALRRRVGFPVDNGNIDEAARIFFEDLRKLQRLKQGEESAGHSEFARHLTLERVIREEQHEENRKLSHTLREFSVMHDKVIASLRAKPPYAPAPDPLRQLLEPQCQVVLVTVNFDHVLETRADGLVEPFATEADLDRFKDALHAYHQHGGRVPLLKLHGDIAHEETLVANSDDTLGGLSTSRLGALVALRDALRPVRPWWYVGYSMRDLDLLPHFSGQTFFEGLYERWVAPMLSTTVREFMETARVPRWEAQHLNYTPSERIISMGAEEFWQTLESCRA